MGVDSGEVLMMVASLIFLESGQMEKRGVQWGEVVGSRVGMFVEMCRVQLD